MKVITFVSRNKDNKNLKDFHQRSKVFMTDKDGFELADYLRPRFQQFVNEGLFNEMSRCYISINNRDMNKTKKALLIHLINNENINLSKIESITCSIAAKPENALEHKWLFDFDCNDRDKLSEFLLEVIKHTPVHFYETPNGFAVITEHGFDTRELLSKYEYVSLKRDSDLCYMWKTRDQI